MPETRPTRLIHRPSVVALISRAATAYLRFVGLTTRWSLQCDAETLALLERGEAAIGVFWHQRLLGVPALWRGLRRAAQREFRAAAIISRHGDGELIARTLGRLGVEQLRGSTNRGGAAAAREAERLLHQGVIIAVVVDGPRGPHGHIHKGALALARRSGRAIVPISFAVDRGLQARSWDRLLVPLPFGRGRLVVGAPLFVPPTADATALETIRADLARQITDLTTAADTVLGVRRAGAAAPLSDP